MDFGPENIAARRDARDDIARLWLCRDDVITQLRPSDVIDYLRQEDVLSETDQELIMSEKTTTAKAKVLLETIFMKGSGAATVLLSALENTYGHLYQQVSNTGVTDVQRRRYLAFLSDLSEVTARTEGVSLEPPEPTEGFDYVDLGRVVGHQVVAGQPSRRTKIGVRSTDVMKNLDRELRDFYIHELSSIRPVPWNEEVVMDMNDFYHNTVLLDITNKTSVSPNPLQGNTSHKVKEILEINSLFQDQGQIKRRILLEGEPGVGKSTLCRKLALDWATAESPPEGAPLAWSTRFDHVIYITADTLVESFVSSIFNTILPDDVVSISSEHLELKFLDPELQEKTLLIIDAFDEAHDKALIHDIWNGKILRKATVLATSRPGLATELLRKVEKRCVIQGFSQTSRDSYIQQYIADSGCHEELMKNIRKIESQLGHLIYVPLYVSLLCMLLEERSDVPETRTKLLTEVIKLSKEWASSKQEVSESHIDDQMETFAKFAFDSLCDPKLATDKSITSKHFTKLGLVVLERGKSKLRPVIRVKFVHKIFHEFLAAKHLASMEYGQMSDAMTGLSEEDKRNVIVFLAGLLSADCSVPLHRFYSEFVCQNVQQISPFENHKLHTGLQCVAETGDFDNIEDLVATLVPKQFHFSSDGCCQCLAGLADICKISRNCSELVIDTSDYSWDKSKSECLRKELALYNTISSVMFSIPFPSFMNVQESIAYYLPVLPFLRHLYVYCGDGPGPRHSEKAGKFGNSVVQLNSFLLKGSTMRHMSGAEHLIRSLDELMCDLFSLLHPSLRTLILKELTLSADICTRINERFPSVGSKTRALILDGLSFSCGVFQHLVQSFIHFDQLKHLEIRNCFEFEKSISDDMHSQDVESPHVIHLGHPEFKQMSRELPSEICTVIGQNQLDTLVVNAQAADWSKLVPNLQLSLKTLTYLDLSFTIWDDPEQVDSLAVVFQESKLSTVILKGMQVNYRGLMCVLKAANVVQHLDLSHNQIGEEDVFSLLCSCLIEKHALKHLSLASCGLTDGTICFLLPFFERSELEVLNLQANELITSDEACGSIMSMLANASTLVSLTMPISLYTTSRMNALIETCQGLRRLNHLKVRTQPSLELQEEMMTWFKPGAEKMPQKLQRLIPQLKTVDFGMSHNILYVSLEGTNEQWHSRARDICLKYGDC